MPPYRKTDDDLLRALGEHVRIGLDQDDDATAPGSGASPEQLALTESRLGFHLPPLLRSVYEIANGGIGPGLQGLYPVGAGEKTLASLYRSFVDSDYRPEPGEPDFDQYPWPERLLPICDWGCAIWSCLDCRSADGPIVTSSNGEPFANTGHTLRSWLAAWLADVDLFEEMFEPDPVRTGINPFTKQPITFKAQGKPKGARWT
jgi:hypothetical protein